MLLSVSKQSLKRSSPNVRVNSTPSSSCCVYCWHKLYYPISHIAPLRRIRKSYTSLLVTAGPRMKSPVGVPVRCSSSSASSINKNQTSLSELDQQLFESNSQLLRDQGFASLKELYDDGEFREEDFSFNLDIRSQAWTDSELAELAFLLRLEQPEFDEDGFMIYDRRKSARLMRAAADYEKKNKKKKNNNNKKKNKKKEKAAIDQEYKQREQEDGFDEFSVGRRMRREPNYYLIDYNYVRLERCKIPRFDTDSEVVLKFLGALSGIEQQQHMSFGGSAPVSDEDLFQLFYLYRAIPQPRPVRIPVAQLESLLNLMRGFESRSELLASRYQILITDLLHSHMPVSSREFTKLIDLVGKPARGGRPTPQHVRRALILAGTMQRHKIPMVVGTYNTILNIAVQAGDVTTSQKIYREMMLNKMRPDRYTFGILAHLFSSNLTTTKDTRQHLRRPQKILELYQQVLDEGEVASIEVVNSLIRALLRCGDYISASSIFRSLLHPSPQSADSIIYGGDSSDPRRIPVFTIDDEDKGMKNKRGGKEDEEEDDDYSMSTKDWQDYLHVKRMFESKKNIASNLVNRESQYEDDSQSQIRLAVTPMTLYEKRKRSIFEKWLVRKRQALMAQGFDIGSGENSMPLIADEATFRMFLTYHCTVLGDYDESLKILKEMESRSIAPADWLFITLFKGFYLNGGIEYSFWSLDKLEAIFKVMQNDSININILNNNRLIYWAINAFERVAGPLRAREISRKLLNDHTDDGRDKKAIRRNEVDNSMGFKLKLLLDEIEKRCSKEEEEEQQQQQQLEIPEEVS